jgi:sterol desaturase/sphingolipid hydroxylase (fatty acid hydroxylase superfamily)
MRLSKTGYYADFAIYAGAMTAATVIAVWRDDIHELYVWLTAAVAGALGWTLIEYVLHRFVLHQMPVFARMHDAHHEAPLAFIGTPTWLSLGVVVGAVFTPAWALGSLNAAGGLTVGVMGGFFWYGVIHHAIHHRRPRLIARRLIVASRRHAQHHYALQSGNFGVTTSFWDRVFGTAILTAAEPTTRTHYQA